MLRGCPHFTLAGRRVDHPHQPDGAVHARKWSCTAMPTCTVPRTGSETPQGPGEARAGGGGGARGAAGVAFVDINRASTLEAIVAAVVALSAESSTAAQQSRPRCCCCCCRARRSICRKAKQKAISEKREPEKRFTEKSFYSSVRCTSVRCPSVCSFHFFLDLLPRTKKRRAREFFPFFPSFRSVSLHKSSDVLLPRDHRPLRLFL